MFDSENPRSRIVIGGRTYVLERHGNRFRWEIGDGSGSRLRRSFATRREAELELRAELSRQLRRRARDAVGDGSSFTLGQIVDMWYERKKRFLDEGGQLDYEDRIRRDVAKIAHWIPERVRRSEIEDFYATLTAHSAHRLHPIFNQAFEYAIENEWVAVTYNPFRRIKPRRPPSKEIEVPTATEVEKMLVEADDHAWYVFLPLSSSLGTRRSETVALRWQDIDFDRGWIHVRHAYAMTDDTQVRRLYGNHIREDTQGGIGAAAASFVLG